MLDISAKVTLIKANFCLHTICHGRHQNANYEQASRRRAGSSLRLASLASWVEHLSQTLLPLEPK